MSKQRTLRKALVGSPNEEGAVVFTPRVAGLVAGALRALERGDTQRAGTCLDAIRGVS